MALSKVEIWNLALQRVRAATVETDTDNTTSAIECRTVYDHLRGVLQQMIPWGFCRRTVALSLTTGTADNWEYEYTYPIC